MIIKSGKSQLQVRESLFWDVSKDNLDPQRNRQLIIERVITRGDLDEFSALLHFYGIKKIRNTLKMIPVLDKKSLNFIIKFFNINPIELKCFQKKL
jgi:hypothetical protein